MGNKICFPFLFLVYLYMEMNMIIDKQNNEIAFNEEAHVYWNTKYPNLKYTSITTLIGKYHDKFDEEFWSRYKALQKLVGTETFDGVKGKKAGEWIVAPAPAKAILLNQKKFDYKWVDFFELDYTTFEDEVLAIKASYKQANEKACTRGTDIHLLREMRFYDKFKHKLSEFKEFNLEIDGEFECERNNFDLNREKAILPEYLLYYSCPDKILNLAGQADMIIKDGNDIYILDYKGLPLDTLILTTEGFKELKDITKDDVIFDKDGKETRIKNVSEIHYNPCFEIHFDNNEKIIADHEHRWLVSFRRSKNSYIEKVMTTEELKNWMDSKPKTPYNIPKIMNAKPLCTNHKDLPIDPYVLGAWLGDGSKASGVITNINPDFWVEIAKRGYNVSHNLSKENKAEMHTVYDLSPALRKANLLNNKHLPSDYLLASYEQRLDLLRGLMDTDGYYNKTRKRFVMATTQQWQVDVTIQILASLGLKSTVIPATKDCNGKKIQGWDVCFHSEVNPFLIRNQYDLPKPKTNKHSFRNIEKIISVNTIPTKCLEVESESHTFLAGKSLLVTHNTNAKGIETKAFFDVRKKKKQMMHYPINNIEDTTFMHYTLQLSCYAWILQRINPNLNIRLLRLIHIGVDGKETPMDLEYKKAEVEKMFRDYKKRLKVELYRETGKLK